MHSVFVCLWFLPSCVCGHSCACCTLFWVSRVVGPFLWTSCAHPDSPLRPFRFSRESFPQSSVAPNPGKFNLGQSICVPQRWFPEGAENLGGNGVSFLSLFSGLMRRWDPAFPCRGAGIMGKLLEF